MGCHKSFLICVICMAAVFIGVGGANATIDVAPGEFGFGSLQIVCDDVGSSYLSIKISPLDHPQMGLERGTTAIFDDQMVIKTNTDWKLTVEDTTPGLNHVKGHMEPYVSDSFSDEKNDELTHGYAILVNDIGENDGILQDATDLSRGPVNIMQGKSTNGLEKTLFFRHSQKVSENEVEGDYGIILTFSLSENI